jgi:hypothetical protein
MSLSPNIADEAKNNKIVPLEYESPLEIETDERASLEIETDPSEIVYSVNSKGQEVPPDENRSCGGRFYNAFAGFLFPRITPIPSTAFIVLSLVAALP